MQAFEVWMHLSVCSGYISCETTDVPPLFPPQTPTFSPCRSLKWVSSRETSSASIALVFPQKPTSAMIPDNLYHSVIEMSRDAISSGSEQNHPGLTSHSRNMLYLQTSICKCSLQRWPWGYLRRYLQIPLIAQSPCSGRLI